MILKELESVYNLKTEEYDKGKIKAIPEDISSLADRQAFKGKVNWILRNFFRQE